MQGEHEAQVQRLGKDAEGGWLAGTWEWARFTGVLDEVQGPQCRARL